VSTSLVIVEALGAKRFDPFLRESLARILFHEGRRQEAVAEVETAMRVVAHQNEPTCAHQNEPGRDSEFLNI
jgi:hypothetical protein